MQVSLQAGRELAVGGKVYDLDSNRGMNSQNQTTGKQSNGKAEEEEDGEIAGAT